jgi:hypothetical protein
VLGRLQWQWAMMLESQLEGLSYLLADPIFKTMIANQFMNSCYQNLLMESFSMDH